MKHRFSKLAKKTAEDLWRGVRMSLAFFENKQAKNYPFRLLSNCLKDAEDLAREALRVIARKLYVIAAPARQQKASEEAALQTSVRRAPIFQLGLGHAQSSRQQEDQVDGHAVEAPLQNAGMKGDAITPAHAVSPVCEAEDIEPMTPLDRRLAALRDVLVDPGRHAARMARALHRQQNETAGLRLALKDEFEIVLDHCDRLADDPGYYGTEEFERLHPLVLGPG